MKLVYVNELGPNFKGNYVYEFIFSTNLVDIWGEEWDTTPAGGKPQPPEIEFIGRVGVFSNEGLEFDLVQTSDYFSFTDAIDGVISLAWERHEEDPIEEGRLVFRFGEDQESVEDKLYSRDLILKYNEEEYKKV
tara:strand:- start:662 stop:1063 length:402 start_codon:yes stop_codon:yes gene_type:complete